MQKFTLLTLAVLGLYAGVAAQASEPAAPAPMVKGTKAYQSRAISDVRPSSDQPAQPSAEPASVEPAAGAEAQGETNADQDTTRNLQQQMKLPRKN